MRLIVGVLLSSFCLMFVTNGFCETKIEDYQGITERFHNSLPSGRFQKIYRPGAKVAVLAGSAKSGRGVHSGEFYTINYDSAENPDFIGNFNRPDLLTSLDSKFDHVVIELPEIRNVWSGKMYETAQRLLKPKGVLEVSFYNEVEDWNFIPARIKESFYLGAIIDTLSYYQIGDELHPTHLLDDLTGGSLRYTSRYPNPEKEIVRKYAMTLLARQSGFRPQLPDYSPGEIKNPVKCIRLSSEENQFFRSGTAHRYEYCYFYSVGTEKPS